MLLEPPRDVYIEDQSMNPYDVGVYKSDKTTDTSGPLIVESKTKLNPFNPFQKRKSAAILGLDAPDAFNGKLEHAYSSSKLIKEASDADFESDRAIKV